ncbi:MAG: flagellar hook-length control protein FliK [Trichloromonadaceae bacterium]
MQTMLVQLPQAPTPPAADKTVSATGPGLFEGLLGETERDLAEQQLDASVFDLLAAAQAMAGLPLAVAADAAPVLGAFTASAQLDAGQDLGWLQLPLAKDLGLEQQQAAKDLAPGLAVKTGLEVAVPVLPEQALAATSLNRAAPLTSPALENPAELAALLKAGAAAKMEPPIQEAVAAAPSSAETVIKASGVLPLVAPLSAALPRGQKPGVETAARLQGQPAVTLAEESASEGAKVPGLTEARFQEMLQGVAKTGRQAAAAAGSPQQELLEAAPAALVKGLAAAPSSQLAAGEGAVAAPPEAGSPVPPSLPGAAVITGPSPAAAPATTPAPAALQLLSGQSVPESEVLGQVLGRVQLGGPRPGSSISMKLYPEELGEVKLELVVEKDRVRALIVAQSQQVQEVLERHLPRLREALQQQGLKVDELQVSVDSRQQDSQRGPFQEQQRAATAAHGAVKGGGRALGAAPEVAPAVLASVPGGLSIRI